MKMAPNKKYLLAYTKQGTMDGFPQVIIFDPVTLKKLNNFAISDSRIDSVEFSGYSNMLLVVSSNNEQLSTLSVWDFLDGHRDIFCKSVIPLGINGACWNPYL